MQPITTSSLQRFFKISICPSLLALQSLLAPAAHAQFSPGNIVVAQIGDGTAVNGAGKSVPVLLQQYDPATLNQVAPISTLTMPVSGTARITDARSLAADGQITLSADSAYIVVPGYDAPTLVAAIASSSAATYNRVLDTVNVIGTAGRAASTVQFDATSIRSGARGTTDDYWAAGGNSGTQYLGNTQPSAFIQTVKTSTRVNQIFNGNLYFSNNTNTLRGIYAFVGMPTAADVPVLFINTGDTSNPMDFAIDATGTIAYIADNSTGAGSIGGIQKWTFDGTNWNNVYTIPVGTTQGALGVTVDWSGANPAIYATTMDNSLVKVIDAGATSTYSVLATAPTNTVFRGVVFSPINHICLPTIVFTNTNVTCNGNTDGAIVTSLGGGAPGTFTYSWTGPGGFTSNNPDISGLTAGIYTLSFTSSAGCSTTVFDTITEPAALVLSNAVSNTPICAGQNIVLGVTSSDPTATYDWTGPNGFTSALPNPIIPNATVAATGTYSVTLHVGVCSSNTITTAVVVNPTPSDTIVAAGPTTFCHDDSVTLQVHSNGTYTYQWQIDGQDIAGATNSSYTTDTGGSYTVTINNSFSCPFTTTAQQVTVLPLPIAVVSPEAGTTVCPGGTLILDAATGPGYTYQWQINGQSIPAATDASFTAASSGDYSVFVSSGQCSATSAAITVNVLTLPVILPQNPTTFCWGSSSMLAITANPGVATTYQWQLNGVNINGATDSVYSGYQPGTYTVNIDFTGVCQEATVAVTLTQLQLPNPDISQNGALLMTGSYVTYQWYENGVAVAGATSATLPVTALGDYYVTVTDNAGCAGVSEPYALTDLTLAVATTTANADIRIFPNPAASVLHIQSPIQVSVTISGLDGKTVLQAANATDVNVGALANGIYILSLTDANGQVVKMQKLVKNAE